MSPLPIPDPDSLISFRHVGFENFDRTVLEVMLGRLAMAATLGAFIAYRPWRWLMPWRFDRTESGAQVLIAVAGALMTVVIGNNVALAFGLVGLGGFIRFRSGIKDPREAGVMFLMIGMGMATGIGFIPVAITAACFGLVLLASLDVLEQHRRTIGRRRLRFSTGDPRTLEPLLRAAIQPVASIRGSKIRLRNDEVVIDIIGETLQSAGEVLALMDAANLKFDGDVSCEET